MTAKIGTLDELLALTAPQLRPILERLRAIVLEVHPEAVEVVRLGDRAVTFRVGPRKLLHGYAYILPYTKWVNIGFYQGAQLPDPSRRLEGTGTTLRHVKVRSAADAADPSIRALIGAALEARRTSGWRPGSVQRGPHHHEHADRVCDS